MLQNFSGKIILLITALFFNQAVLAEDVIMRLHGSNTVGAELGPELVKAWLRSQGYTQIQQKQLAAEELEIVARHQRGSMHKVEIKSHGSGTGFKSLAQGANDIAMASRPIKAKEQAKLTFLGDLTKVESEFVIGLDGIAVIVNKNNPIDHLDKKLIKRIFSGQIRNWSQVDKRYSGRIQVYARDNQSGTYDTFKSLVLGKKSPLVKNAKRYESNAILSDDVAQDRYGIGFVGLPYVRQSKAIAVAEQGALPKQAKPFDVATEDYALSRRLYMYVPVLPSKQKVASFIEFCLSSEGQDIVKRTGFISQNLVAQSIELNPGFPEEYLEFTKGAERLSLNFRFRKGTIKLDNKSLRDVDRLSKYMALPENRSKKIMLFGFADRSESLPVFSVDLSTYRADWVADMLIRKRMSPVRVRAYGNAIPVASNEEPGGRHKNRRVEVWLR